MFSEESILIKTLPIMTKNNQLFIPISYGKRLLLLTLMFFVMSVLASFSVQFAKQIFDEGTRNYMLLASSLQALIMFVVPAFASSFFISQTPMRMLGLNKSVNIRNILGIILMFVLVMPALNQVIWWNSQLSLPDALKDVETWMREMESNAAEMQSILLSSTTIGGLISSILVVGVLTGFAEEVFFRGALQRVISSNGMNPHMAIFIAAFIFSLLHFQFFGFVPRLILGMFFGYIFYWTGSIWASSIAHAINNSIVVVTLYLTNNGFDISNIEQFGVDTTASFPTIAIISAVATGLLMVFGHKYFFSSSKKK